MAPQLDDLLADLADEHRDLDAVVSQLSESTWRAPTLAEGWSIADQISHLAFFDERAAMAMTDPDGFTRDFEQMVAEGRDASVDRARSLTPVALLADWRVARSALVAAARDADPAVRVPWYGPAMSLRSCVTARLMETWAHGQDVVDALGVDRPGTTRLRHVAHIAVVRGQPIDHQRIGPRTDRDVGDVTQASRSGTINTQSVHHVLTVGPGLHESCRHARAQRHRRPVPRNASRGVGVSGGHHECRASNSPVGQQCGRGQRSGPID